MTIVITAIAFIVLLTLLILVHEMGHYMLARFFHVTVEEFGFGLPPKAKTLFHYDGTDFTLNWVPFGGFVRMKGENSLDGPERSEKGSFARASLGARFCILLGGVAMNFLLAIFLLTIGFSAGKWVPSWYSSFEELQAAQESGDVSVTLGVMVSDVEAGSPAARAGLENDMILSAVNGIPVETSQQVVDMQKEKTEVTYTVRDEPDAPARDIVIMLEDSKAGVAIQTIALDLTSPTRPVSVAFVYALKETAFMSTQTIYGIGNLFRSLFGHGYVPEGITGIVGIAVLTHSSVEQGFMTYLRLVALLSLSLAILNVLPLPALDGGRILFVLVEGIMRRPLNRKFELVTNAVGFFLIIGLIVVITFNDIVHLF